MRSPSRRAGYTLIELGVATLLLALMTGSITMATRSAMGSFAQSSANGDINSRAARALDRISRELMGARATNLTPSPDLPFGTDTLEFERPATTAAGAITWSGRTRIGLQMAAGELDNGLDDNANGSIDERSIVRIDDPGLPDERRTVLISGISEFLQGETGNALDDNGNGVIDERGLSFVEVGGNLVIRLSLERLGPDGRIMIRTQETEVLLRNQ